jgi:deazaflavin-dependent oxidoreductase (nitroreductase family)
MQLPKFAKTVIRGFSTAHTSLFRALGGKGFFNRNTLILTTRGRKSGREVSTPLLYVAEGDRLYIVASFGGSDVAPGWYFNLTANPEVTVERDGERRPYRARTMSTEEAGRVWPKLLAIWPAYAGYQKRTNRVIPIVELAASS